MCHVLKIILFLLCLIPQTTQGQIEHLATLKINSVEKKNDIIWVATAANGLIKIDVQNKTQENFNVLNSNICSNDIFNVAIDKQGKIWATTSNGLCLFDGQDGRIIRGRKKSSWDFKEVIFIDSKDNKILIEKRKVTKFDNNGRALKTLAEESFSKLSVKELNPNVILILSYSGLFKLENEKLTKLKLNTVLRTGKMEVVQDTIFIGGSYATTIKKIVNLETVVEEKQEARNNLIFDKYANQWEFRRNFIEQLTNRKKKKWYSRSTTLPNDYPILAVFFDKENNLFMFNQKGCYLKKEGARSVETVVPFNNFIDYPIDKNVLIKSAAPDNFWLIHDDLVQFCQLNQSNQTTKIYQKPIEKSKKFLFQSYINNAETASNASLIVGDFEGSVDSLYINNNGIQSKRLFDKVLAKNTKGLNSNQYYSFHMDEQKNLWYFEYSSIRKINRKGQSITISSPYGLDRNKVNIKWLGEESFFFTTDREVILYKKGYFTPYLMPFDYKYEIIKDFEVNPSRNTVFAANNNKQIFKKKIGQDWELIHPKRGHGKQNIDFLGFDNQENLVLKMEDNLFVLDSTGRKKLLFRNDNKHFKQVYSIAFSEKKYYLATDNGVFIVPFN